MAGAGRPGLQGASVGSSEGATGEAARVSGRLGGAVRLRHCGGVRSGTRRRSSESHWPSFWHAATGAVSSLQEPGAASATGILASGRGHHSSMGSEINPATYSVPAICPPFLRATRDLPFSEGVSEAPRNRVSPKTNWIASRSEADPTPFVPSAETLRCPGGRRPSSPEAGVLLEGEPDPDLSALNLTAETASAGPVVQLNEDGQLIKH